MQRPIGRIDLRHLSVPAGDVIALDPGAVVAVGDIVFRLAGLDAGAAADALGHVDQHAPPVIGHLVVRRCLRSAGEDRVPGDGSSGQQNQQMAAGDGSLAPSAVDLSGYAACDRCRKRLRRNGRLRPPAGSLWAWRCWLRGSARTAPRRRFAEAEARWDRPRAWPAGRDRTRTQPGHARPCSSPRARRCGSFRKPGDRRRPQAGWRRRQWPRPGSDRIVRSCVGTKRLRATRNNTIPSQKDRCHSEEVPCILEICHSCNRE